MVIDFKIRKCGTAHHPFYYCYSRHGQTGNVYARLVRRKLHRISLHRRMVYVYTQKKRSYKQPNLSPQTLSHHPQKHPGNTLSNLIFHILALIGLYNALRLKSERRVVYCFLSLAAVGTGSALFHGSLTYGMQLMDELPMIYGSCVFLFSMWVFFSGKRWKGEMFTHFPSFSRCIVYRFSPPAVSRPSPRSF